MLGDLGGVSLLPLHANGERPVAVRQNLTRAALRCSPVHFLLIAAEEPLKLGHSDEDPTSNSTTRCHGLPY